MNMTTSLGGLRRSRDWVMSRGTVLVDSNYVGNKGHGQYLKRDLSQYLL